MLKKIRTQREIAKRNKRNQIVVGVVLITLLVVSTMGYSLMNNDSEDENAVNELGVDFVRDGGLWKAVFDGNVFGFQYLPSEVDYISINGTYDFENYVGEILYFVGANEGASEVLNNLGSYVLRYQEACIGHSSCAGDLPIKDCYNNLIIFESGNQTMVWKNESCVYIVGDSIRGADAFLYKALKIT